jgi:hypothetical protein
MSEVKTRSRRATYGEVPINRDAFLSACAALGANTTKERADLLGTTPKMAYLYEYGHSTPSVFTAWRIADTLGVKPEDLWEKPKPGSQSHRRAA